MSRRSTVRQMTGCRRSRYGCRNCKLRKTKCDERKPDCGNCVTFGVVCNFDFKVPDLQPLIPNRPNQKVVITRKPKPVLNLPISNGLSVSHGTDAFSLDLQDQELFHRFRHRTLSSLWGPTMSHVCGDRTFGDCFVYLFLMHGVLAISALHDRYLGIKTSPHIAVRETYHLTRCVVLFKKALTSTIDESQKDAIWATAVFLAILTMSSTMVSCPEQSWPLASSDSSTVEWLRLKASDKALWTLTNPLRAGSVFSTISETLSQMEVELPAKGIHGMLLPLAQLCQLDESSTPETSPYFLFAHGLSRLLQEPWGQASLGVAFVPVNNMPILFRTCLEEKDNVALLLLCLWYSRARECKWWIEFRARHAIPAICTYLQTHGPTAAMQALLPASSEDYGNLWIPGVGSELLHLTDQVSTSRDRIALALPAARCAHGASRRPHDLTHVHFRTTVPRGPRSPPRCRPRSLPRSCL